MHNLFKCSSKLMAEEEVRRYSDRVMGAWWARGGVDQRPRCQGCDYEVPLVPGTERCADCTWPGDAVGAYREMKSRKEKAK